MSDRQPRTSRRNWLRIKIRTLIILVLAAGGSFGLVVRGARIRREAIDAKENQRISEDIGVRAGTSQPGPLNMVGSLAATTYWSKLLPLTEEQKVVITRLDNLVRKCHKRSLMSDAQPFDGPAAVRRQRVAHNDERRSRGYPSRASDWWPSDSSPRRSRPSSLNGI